MIPYDEPKLVRQWNNMSAEAFAFFLQFIFSEHHNDEDVQIHNFIIRIILGRLGAKNRDRLLSSVADLIERYSLESKDGTQKESKEKRT